MNTINRALRRWWNSEPATHGAALAYYAIFSLAPLFIIFVVALGGLFGREAVEGKLLNALQSVMGQSASEIIQALVAYAAEPITSTIAAILSIFFTIIGALALFSQVERALAAIWLQDERAAVARTFLRTKIMAVLIIILLGLLIIASFILNAIAAFLATQYGGTFIELGVVLNFLSSTISFGYIVVIFSVMYKFLPGIHVSWSAAIVGGIVGGVLFIIGRTLLALYITGTVVFSTYGAAGAVILVLVWFFYSAQIFFFGGAVSYAIDETDSMRQTSL